MAAGRMRDRISFQRLDATADAYGNASDGTFSTFLTVWCELITSGVRERLSGGRVEAQADAVARVRYSDATLGVTEADRASIGGVTYQIVGIDNPESRNKYLLVSLVRGVAT